MTSPASTLPSFTIRPTSLKSITTGSCSGSRSDSARAALVHLPGMAMRAWRSSSMRRNCDSLLTTTVGPYPSPNDAPESSSM